MTKTTQADAVKFYARRDSATTVLRKMGIHTRDYNAFIEVMSDGQFACHIARAEMHLESLKNPKPAETKVVKAPASTETKSKRTGISATARELILAGKTNQEVWAELKQQFDLDDSKKHYPTWYRCEMKRKGQLV
jgi:hypothetical protein